MFNQIRYNWLRDKQNNPVACIASAQLVDEKIMKALSIHYALAIYNSKDKFSKELGRQVAFGRLNYHQRCDGFAGVLDPDLPNMKLAILKAIASAHDLPSHVRAAAKHQISVYKPGPKVNA